jgi:hypothetical protein
MKTIFLSLASSFLFAVSFGQTIGTETENEIIYKSNGLKIYYTIVYMGSGDCGIKYKVNIFIENKGEDKISVAGSLIDVDNSFVPWQNNYNQCAFQGQILLGVYPAYEKWKVIAPDFSDMNSHTVYMNANTTKLPKVSWNIIPKIVRN